jgi:hypothetical protein
MNRYPTGNEIRCRYYFATRDLTDTEEAAFFAGQGLPPGVGYDPPTVVLIYTPPDSERKKLEGANVTKDAVGAYHSILTPQDNEEGQWLYKGRGLNSESVAVATTKPVTFTAYNP